MNHYHLRALITISDNGSFSKAAKILNISPQALMQQINLLEAQAGVTIFTRSNKGISLTVAGKILYDGAKHILKYSEQLLKDCQNSKNSERMLKLGLSQDMAHGFIYAVCNEFRKQHPEIMLYIMDTDSNEKLSAVQNGELDICDSFDIEILSHYNLKFTTAIDEGLLCIMSKSHPLASKTSIRQEDLQKQTLLIGCTLFDNYGNKRFLMPLENVTCKTVNKAANRKIEVALKDSIYFDFQLDISDFDTLIAIPYVSPHLSFGFLSKENPSKDVLLFLDIVKRYAGILKAGDWEQFNARNNQHGKGNNHGYEKRLSY